MPSHYFEKRRSQSLLGAFSLTLWIIGLFAFSGCASVAPQNVEDALADLELAVQHLESGIDVLRQDPALEEAARDFLLAYGDLQNARADLLGRQPERSCIDRCTDCQNDNAKHCKACPVFSCLSNCSAGHHPVCLYGCTPGGDCPYGNVGTKEGLAHQRIDNLPSCRGAPRDYKALAEKLIEPLSKIEAVLDGYGDGASSAAASMAEIEGIMGPLESCGSRCDNCGHCHSGQNDCHANGCCDPVDCWDNCLEKQHPVCCAGC